MEATRSLLVAAVERHYYAAPACAEAGVSPATLRRWENDDAELAAALDDARAGALDALAAETVAAARAGRGIEAVRIADIVSRRAEAVEARRGPGRARRERIAAAAASSDDADAMTEAQIAAVDEVADVPAGLIPEDEADPPTRPVAHLVDRARTAALAAARAVLPEPDPT